MAKTTTTTTTKDPKVIDEEGREVLDPKQALVEQTIAVELAGVEIDKAIATAHKFPRSIDVAVRKMTNLACYNEESAQSCVYALPRGDKPIIGPSIGMANIIFQSWGNCRAAARIVFIDTKQKVVKAEGAFVDLETNAYSVSPVDRRIVGRGGRLYNEDMQIVTGMAAASIARRNAILNGVPRGIWWPVYMEALGIVRGNVSTLAENRDKAIAAMAQFGVSAEKLFQALSIKGATEFTLEHLPLVRGMYSALKDGSITVEEMFDPRRLTGRGFEVVENPLGEEQGGSPAAEEKTEEEDAKSEAAAEARAEEEEAAAAGAAGGEDLPAAETAKAAAPKAPVAPKAEAATKEPAKEKAAGEPAKAAAKVVQAAEPEAGPDRGAIKTPEDYLTYWEGWLQGAKSAAEVTNQWSQDRPLRTTAMVTQNYYTEAAGMKEARIAELKKGGAS